MDIEAEIEAIKKRISELEESAKRSAPAMRAAWNHVPIGPGNIQPIPYHTSDLAKQVADKMLDDTQAVEAIEDWAKRLGSQLAKAKD